MKTMKVIDQEREDKFHQKQWCVLVTCIGGSGGGGEGGGRGAFMANLITNENWLWNNRWTNQQIDKLMEGQTDRHTQRWAEPSKKRGEITFPDYQWKSLYLAKGGIHCVEWWEGGGGGREVDGKRGFVIGFCQVSVCCIGCFQKNWMIVELTFDNMK